MRHERPRAHPRKVRTAIFASKEARRRLDAQASPEERLLRLEAMQELTDEVIRARSTLQPVPAKKI